MMRGGGNQSPQMIVKSVVVSSIAGNPTNHQQSPEQLRLNFQKTHSRKFLLSKTEFKFHTDIFPNQLPEMGNFLQQPYLGSAPYTPSIKKLLCMQPAF